VGSDAPPPPPEYKGASTPAAYTCASGVKSPWSAHEGAENKRRPWGAGKAGGGGAGRRRGDSLGTASGPANADAARFPRGVYNHEPGRAARDLLRVEALQVLCGGAFEFLPKPLAGSGGVSSGLASTTASAGALSLSPAKQPRPLLWLEGPLRKLLPSGLLVTLQFALVGPTVHAAGWFEIVPLLRHNSAHLPTCKRPPPPFFYLQVSGSLLLLDPGPRGDRFAVAMVVDLSSCRIIADPKPIAELFQSELLGSPMSTSGHAQAEPSQGKALPEAAAERSSVEFFMRTPRESFRVYAETPSEVRSTALLLLLLTE